MTISLTKTGNTSSANKLNKETLAAAEAGRIDKIIQLIQEGADVNTSDMFNDTPLHFACREGYTTLIQMLLVYGAKVNRKNVFGLTPLHYAVQKGNPVCVRMLLEADADIHLKNDCEEPAIHFACRYRDNGEVVHLLVNQGAEVNHFNRSLDAPIHEAAAKGFTHVVRELLAGEADVNIKDEHGNTPLHLAVANCQVDVAKLLIKNGANVNTTNRGGNNPLHEAIHFALDINELKEISCYLLTAGCNPHCRNKLNETPLSLALDSHGDFGNYFEEKVKTIGGGPIRLID